MCSRPGAPPPEWGTYSHSEWRLLTPVVPWVYIKRARSYRAKNPVSNNAPSTSTTGTGTATSEPLLEEGHRVYLNRARIVGHGTVFRGDVPQLLEKLPRTDTNVHVYMTGPFTKEEKALAVEPIRCELGNVRKLWSHMSSYNKPLLGHVSSDLDEGGMTALQESLVDMNEENEPATESSGETFIGTNLLVDDHASSNDDVVDEVEAASADVSASEPNDATMIDTDDVAELFGSDDERQHVMDDDDMTEEEANLEAIAHRVREEYFVSFKTLYSKC
jgi:hypothetical protein